MTAWSDGGVPGRGSVSLTVQLLGRPQLRRAAGEPYRFRSRKSWTLLAYLVMTDRAPTRGQLASLLFAEADDPMRALRWSLSEIRRGLGDGGALDGDPVVLSLAADTVVDVDVLLRGSSAEAVRLPGLGADLLDGFAVPNAPALATWLLSEQRHVAAATEAVLHEAALGAMSRGDLDVAVAYAARVAAMNPLDENHHALVIRLYRLLGDDRAAQRQYAICRETFQRELGVPVGPAVASAMHETRREPGEVDASALEALIEAGAAAVTAGASDAGVQSLRTAARLADSRRPPALRVRARLVLAEALIHALRGLDEEGLAALFEADEIARGHHLADAVADARCELGYVDYLRARYERAASGSPTPWRTQVPPRACRQGHDLPGRGGQRHGRVPRGGRGAARARGRAVQSRPGPASRGLRAVDARPHRPAPGRPGRGRGPVGRVRRTGRAQSLAGLLALAAGVTRRGPAGPGRPRRRRPGSSSRPSPAPVRSAIPAGRASRPAASRWWPRRAATPDVRSRSSPTPGCARTGWPTPTSGSTPTSWTPSAPSAGGTVTPTSGPGWKPCGS